VRLINFLFLRHGSPGWLSEASLDVGFGLRHHGGSVFVPKMFTSVHVHGSSTSAAAPHTLRAMDSTVTLFAEQFHSVVSYTVAVQGFFAKTALEARALVVRISSGQEFLGLVYGLAALGTLGTLDGLERHVHLVRWGICGRKMGLKS